MAPATSGQPTGRTKGLIGASKRPFLQERSASSTLSLFIAITLAICLSVLRPAPAHAALEYSCVIQVRV
jgi:hypothetical protein